ncbi:hypothetical protein LP420_31675 [Massilia sp. B-10]|nr:hypothetical protein LP420_31675 [Massilia sp. B-10]
MSQVLPILHSSDVTQLSMVTPGSQGLVRLFDQRDMRPTQVVMPVQVNDSPLRGFQVVSGSMHELPVAAVKVSFE